MILVPVPVGRCIHTMDMSMDLLCRFRHRLALAGEVLCSLPCSEDQRFFVSVLEAEGVVRTVDSSCTAPFCPFL